MLGEGGLQRARHRCQKWVALVLAGVLEELFVQRVEVRGVRYRELAELLAHLGRLAPDDQHRHLLDVLQLTARVLRGRERLGFVGPRALRQQHQGETTDESRHGVSFCDSSTNEEKNRAADKRRLTQIKTKEGGKSLPPDSL